MIIQYKGRDLDVACLVRLASLCPVIRVEALKLNFLDLRTKSGENYQRADGELLLHPNGDSYDVLSGSPPKEEELSKAAKKRAGNAVFPARLVSKQMLKKVEDISINGCEVAPPPEPRYEPRPYTPRNDNYDRGQPRFNNDRPAFQPRPNGPPYQPTPKGPPYAPTPQQRPQEPLPGSLQQSMQKLAGGLMVQLSQAPLAQAQAKPLESATSHRPINGNRR